VNCNKLLHLGCRIYLEQEIYLKQHWPAFTAYKPWLCSAVQCSASIFTNTMKVFVGFDQQVYCSACYPKLQVAN
jgi:hypothetical protein